MRGFLNFVQAKQHLPYLQNLNALKLSISLSSIFANSSCANSVVDLKPKSNVKSNSIQNSNLPGPSHTNAGNSNASQRNSVMLDQASQPGPEPNLTSSRLDLLAPDDSVSCVSVNRKCVAFLNTIEDAPNCSSNLSNSCAPPNGLQTEIAQPPRDKKTKRDRAAVSSGADTRVSKVSKAQASACLGSELTTDRLSPEKVRAVKDFFSQNKVLENRPPHVKIKCRKFVKITLLLRNSGFDQSEVDALCLLGGSMWLCYDGPIEISEIEGWILSTLMHSWKFSVKEYGWTGQLNFIATAFDEACVKLSRKCTCQ